MSLKIEKIKLPLTIPHPWAGLLQQMPHPGEDKVVKCPGYAPPWGGQNCKMPDKCPGEMHLTEPSSLMLVFRNHSTHPKFVIVCLFDMFFFCLVLLLTFLS